MAVQFERFEKELISLPPSFFCFIGRRSWLCVFIGCRTSELKVVKPASDWQIDYVIVLTSERLLGLLLESCLSSSEVLLLLRCEVVKPVYGLCS